VQQARFEGKVVVVTGASSGMGLAAAELLAAEGAMIVAVGRRKEVLEKAAAQIKAAGASSRLKLSVSQNDSPSHDG
jgi:NADP-dependent 3-hydroxy acid dehydrogenase YdfG